MNRPIKNTSTPGQNRLAPGKSIAAKELQTAGNLVNALLLAWKNCGLYPEGHAAVINSLEQLMAAFADFFASHASLQLTVEKNRFLYATEILHEASSDSRSEDMVLLLYRDGIQTLEFHRGLTLGELTYFFRILNKYRLLAEETEGDIVTGLIDGDLDHIQFKAIDILWQDQPLLDFSSLNIPPPETQSKSRPIEPEAAAPYGRGEHKVASAKSISDPSFSETLWEISPAEVKELQKMVLVEENWDNTEDVFDVLVVILRNQTDQYNFSLILDFVLEEVVETVEQGEFDLLLKLFQSLQLLLFSDTQTEYSWSRLLIARFFKDLSRPEIFERITAKLLTLKNTDTEKIKGLRQVLLYFSPRVILSLGPVILQTDSAEVEKMVLEVIEYLCLKDMDPLEKILDQPDKELAEKLLGVLSRLKGERADKVFLKMVKHPSEKVRSRAVKMLVAKDPKIVAKLFYLIDDRNGEIRKDILAGIARQKSTMVENLLLKYIKEALDKKDPEHIHACYEALGRCGSVAATQFLKRILLSQGWNRFTGFGKPLHREGAAKALALIRTWEAEDILLEASKSTHPVIRQAFEKSVGSFDALRGKNNG